VIERAIEKALVRFFESERGERLLGSIVIKAVNQALTREIRFEDSKENRGRVVEKTETWNILDWLVKYFPYMEGALRGCQSDAAQARNRASEVKQALHGLTMAFSRVAILPQAPETGRDKVLEHADVKLLG
jgi:hypothetical protein